ncbi:hypothetical protein VP01_982g1 [Puccinia sorghi]|uniref:Uncharacterized protein n=1 Tax=Puccinia sorghi TaxID=27349 RepID=A0A0L6U5N8_9BASI|nr:hypothetical protein VP01_982g1 [Puccinia sorghi]
MLQNQASLPKPQVKIHLYPICQMMSQSLRGLTNCMFFLAQMILTFTKILLVPFLAKGLFHSLQNLPIGFPNHFSAHNDTSHLDPSNFHMPPEHFVYCKHQNILNIESFHGK